MAEDRKREFPDWEKLYRDEAVESMPWYHEPLDADFEGALKELGAATGRALDLGTGPGTQAMALAERGLSVTATDLSATAVANAAKIARSKGLDIEWMEDDILSTRLKGGFDFIFDRGCFHVLPPGARGGYAATIHRLLSPGGHLFLKCFSHLETMEGGPYRFTPDSLRDIFKGLFTVCSIRASSFMGTLEKAPKALFCVMRKN